MPGSQVVTSGSPGASSRGIWRIVAGILLVALFMAASTAVVFHHLIVTPWDQVSGMFDVAHFFGPQTFYMDFMLQRGEFPLWNPLTYCGTPYAANPQVAAFYPLNILRSLLTFQPTPANTHAGMVLLTAVHLIIAGVATYYFARGQGIGKGGSCVAALAYVFSASFVRRAIAFQFVSTVAWLPVLLLLLERASREERPTAKSLWYAIAGGAALAMSLLAGFVQIANYVVVYVACFYVLHRLAHLRWWPTEGAFSRFRKRVANDVSVAVVVGLVATLLAAVLLLPGIEFAERSNRLKDNDVAMVGGNQPKTPLDFVYQSLVVYPGPKDIRMNLRSAGAGVLMLAACALLMLRRRPVVVHFVLFFMFLDASLGPPYPISRLILWGTPFRLVEPDRAFIITCFPLGILTGFGLDAVSRKLTTVTWRTVRTIVVLAIGAAVLIPLWHWVTPHDYLKATRLVFYVPFALLAGALCAGWIPYPRLWRGALPALILLEIALWNGSFIPYRAAARSFPALAAIQESPDPWMDNRRGADPNPNQWLYDMKAAMNGYDPIYIKAVRQLLCSPAKENRYWRKLDRREVTAQNHRGNLMAKRSFWLARQYVIGPLPGKDELFPAAVTVFLDEPPGSPLPELPRGALPATSVSEDRVTTIIAAEDMLPVFVGQTPRNRNALRYRVPQIAGMHGHSALRITYRSNCYGWIDTNFRNIREGTRELGKRYDISPSEPHGNTIEIPMPDFRPIQPSVEVTITTDSGIVHLLEVAVLTDRRDEDALIEIVDRSANRVVVKLHELPGPRFLTFMDGNYPGWRAYLDGEEVKLFKANEAFKGIPVPKGSHTVEFRFRPRSVFLGATVTGVTAALLVGAALFSLARHILQQRRNTLPTPVE